MINRAPSGHRTDVQKHANARLKTLSKRVEEPALRIDLLLVFFLQAKDDLHGDNSVLRAFNLVSWGDRDYRGLETAGKGSVGNTHFE